MNEPRIQVIWKYPIHVSDYIEHIEMPSGARFLFADIQNGQPHMWFLVDRVDEKEIRRFRVVGTGQPTIRSTRDEYLGSFQQPPFVWHLFEVFSEGKTTKSRMHKYLLED